MRSSQAVTVGSPLSTAHLPRPDPARGIFETLLIVDGRPVELDAHLDRLAASSRELFGPPAMARITGPARALVEARADRLALARLRLTLTPDPDGRLDLSATAAEVAPATVFPATDPGVELAPVTVAGGLGRHKWADRRLLDQAAAALHGRLPLIVDGDGYALEAERANLFALHGNALVTPPDDGRILPGIARRRTIGVARELGMEVQEQPIALDDLYRADEIFLTGSVRGIEPVGEIAGHPTQSVRADGPIAARIGAMLRERWLGRD
jgi:para-aminobenzoate synthetase/4-amino-4-deoxychorismate lyase